MDQFRLDRPSLTDPDTVYAGVEDAALFRSTDGGQEWRTVRGLRAHLNRPSIDDERPPVEGAGDLADQDEMLSRDGERTQSSRDVG